MKERPEVKKQGELDWQAIRTKAASFPKEAFDFVREGLAHTVKSVHGNLPQASGDPADESRHVSGQQLCCGLRDLAVSRYGLLAKTVLRHWNVTKTEDFGTIVYTLIDRGELRCSSRDTMDDFRDVYDFADSFPSRLKI